MKELFPLMTFQQDAVLQRLKELYENEVDLDSRVEDLEELPVLPSPAGQGGKVVTVKSDGSGYELQTNPVDPSDLQGVDIEPKDVDATGNITGASIIENMSGYDFSENAITNITSNVIYAGAVKNGNKLTVVLFGEITRTGEVDVGYINSAYVFIVPNAVANKLYPNTIGGVGDVLSDVEVSFIPEDNYTQFVKVPCLVFKYSSQIVPNFYNVNTLLTLNKKYTFRFEQTFLLSDNLAQ